MDRFCVFLLNRVKQVSMIAVLLCSANAGAVIISSGFYPSLNINTNEVVLQEPGIAGITVENLAFIQGADIVLDNIANDFNSVQFRSSGSISLVDGDALQGRFFADGSLSIVAGGDVFIQNAQDLFVGGNLSIRAPSITFVFSDDSALELASLDILGSTDFFGTMPTFIMLPEPEYLVLLSVVLMGFSLRKQRCLSDRAG